MGVYIEMMEKPKYCSQCVFCRHEYNDSYRCRLTNQEIPYDDFAIKDYAPGCCPISEYPTSNMKNVKIAAYKMATKSLEAKLAYYKNAVRSLQVELMDCKRGL